LYRTYFNAHPASPLPTRQQRFGNSRNRFFQDFFLWKLVVAAFRLAMYFVSGWPQLLTLPFAEPILDVKNSPDGSVFAVLTREGVYLFSAMQVQG